MIKKYKKELQSHLKANKIWERLSGLIDNQSENMWSEEERRKLIQIDETITQGMLAAETKAGSENNLSWSVELMQATITAAYWRLSLRGMKTGRDFSTRLIVLAEKAQIPQAERIANTRTDIAN